jgi:hypothetical protein
MAAPIDLKLDGLNFEEIRANFKLFLQNQTEFLDYNFEGSGIGVLLDVLSYNTYYTGFYQNMVATEGFLATAQKRNSVVNLAKALNYTPRSASSAKILGTLKVTPVGSPASVTIPKYTKFQAAIDGTTYTFLNESAVVVFNNSGTYVSTEPVRLIEGRSVSEKYTYNVNDPDQRFIISNPSADTTTLTVKVQNSSTDSTIKFYTLAADVITLSSTSEVYYLEEVEDGKFRVTFGDDVISKKLVQGNIVYLDYIVSTGTSSNGIKAFTLSSTVDGISDLTFTPETGTSSSGGQDRESIASIKFAAPKTYAAQNRAVTAEDYEALMLTAPNVGSVAVWGGQDNDPPAYGKVFIAVRPVFGDVLSTSEKLNIINSIINPKRVLAISTEIVDPDYIYLGVNLNVKYDPNQTVETETSLRGRLVNAVIAYNDESLNSFSKYYRQSALSRVIDNTDRSVISSSISATMTKEFNVQLNVAFKYTVRFSNAINNATLNRLASNPYGAGNKVTSNEFSYGGFTNCFLEDNGGLIRIYRKVGTTNVPVAANVGTIDYDAGTIILNDFIPTAFADGGVELRITAIPASSDVLPLRGQIVTIRDEDITLTLIDDNSISLVRR